MFNFAKITADVLEKLKLVKKCEGLNHIGVYWESSEYLKAHCGACARPLTDAEQEVAAKHRVAIPRR